MNVRLYVACGDGISMDDISAYRKERILGSKHEMVRIEQKAAAEALNMGLREYGLLEKDMEYAFREQGKPYFANHPEIEFSVSHSKGTAVSAFADGPVGVDIEPKGRVRKKLVEKYFSEAEHFLDETVVWTAREAFVKAVGCGMRIPFEGYEVEPAGENKYHIKQSINDKNYMVETLEYGDYVISVCTEE